MPNAPDLRQKLLRLLGHQHWIPRGRDFVIRRFCNPDTVTDTPYEVDFYGLRYRGNLASYLDWMIYFYGAYARCELLLLRDLVDRLSDSAPISFYDVGANVGQHSLFMSRIADCVLAFEPFSRAADQFEAQIALNAVDNIRLFRVGLAAENAQLPFHQPATANLGTGSFCPTSTPAPGEMLLDVRRGDDLIGEASLPKITILKIDTEGFEAEVLAGLAATLRKDRPIVLMELSARSRSSFRSAAGLSAALYPEHRLFAVSATNVSGNYRLQPFRFDATDELIAVPAEFAPTLSDFV